MGNSGESRDEPDASGPSPAASDLEGWGIGFQSAIGVVGNWTVEIH
jgi:hypothetical protein